MIFIKKIASNSNKFELDANVSIMINKKNPLHFQACVELRFVYKV